MNTMKWVMRTLHLGCDDGARKDTGPISEADTDTDQ